MNNKDLQTALRSIGYYKGTIDGILGPKSMAAIGDFLGVNRIGYHRWGKDRQILAAKQMVARLAGIETGVVDGLMGPQTRYAFEAYAGRMVSDRTAETWRDNEPPPPVVGLKPVWPRQADVSKFYGTVGKNQAIIQLPYPMRIAWDRSKTIERMSCHEKVADSVVRVLTRVADAYDHRKRQELGLDLFGGCLNVRKMRGGSSYSMHSWGIAIDFDPERNGLYQTSGNRDTKGRPAAPARLARADCDTFWRLWEEEGWLSLGRARNYDWMHVQAARL